MATNIQMNRKTSDSEYQSIYPISDAAKVERRQKIINYLDGNTLEEIIQNTANRYINPWGDKWTTVNTFNSTNTCLCGEDNFICFLYVDNNKLYGFYSSNNGLTWDIYTWDGNVSLNSMIGGVAIRGLAENTFNICVANATSTSYYLTIDINDSSNNKIESYPTFTGTVTGILKTNDSFMMYGNSGYIYLSLFGDTSWTTSNVLLPNNITKIIYSNKYRKPIGIKNSNQVYTTWFGSLSSWATSNIMSTSATIVDINNTGDIFLGSDGIVYDTIKDKTYKTPSLNGDSWQYILTTSDCECIFIISTQGRLARKTETDGGIELVGNVNLGSLTNGSFLILNNQIFGKFKENTGQLTTLIKAPLYSYK